jgi:penicillin-binding protein 1C
MRVSNVAIALGVALALVLVLALACLEYATRPVKLVLPRAERVSDSRAHLLDRRGEVVQTVRMDARQRRAEWISLEGISPAFLATVLRAEDQRFYSHSGVDGLAVLHAVWQNMRPASSGAKRGASTISMQLAGHLLHLQNPGVHSGARRSVLEKLAQMRAAWSLERSSGKQEILEAYLNTVSFRGELQGVAAASRGLFGKHPNGLNQRESAVLASLLSTPQAASAVVAKRACRLLGGECEPLLMPVAYLNRPQSFAEHDQLAPHLGVKLRPQLTAGSVLRTTLDARVQRLARSHLEEQLRELQDQRVEDGAVVVLDNISGDVLAYVGSSGKLSGAEHVDSAMSLRQAGSTLKPFLYGLAIEQRRLTAASLLDDSALAIATADAQYLPRNYGHDFKGWVSVRRALASSLNVPAVRTLALLDPDDFVQRLRDVGLPSVSQDAGYYGYSLALGSAEVRLLDLTNAYRTLANQGMASSVRFTRQPGPQAVRVMTAGSVQIVNDILADNEARSLAFGLDSALRLPFRVSAKTGTSKDMRDNWAIGFSRDFTVGVWVGNASGRPMKGVSGVSGAAPVWRAIMLGLHDLEAQTGTPLLLDPLVKRMAVQFVGVSEPSRDELFLVGTQMSEVKLAQALVSNAPLQGHIVQPLNGAIYSMDPDIPLSRQVLMLKQQAGSGRWEMDGKLLSAKPRQAWKLEPGRHRLVLRGNTGKLLDEVRFEVREPTRL